jgi:rubrerythrin
LLEKARKRENFTRYFRNQHEKIGRGHTEQEQYEKEVLFMSNSSVPFEQSQTKENLMRAFAGESQARNRYTIAAGEAKKQGLAVLQGLFLFTADQERVHAQQFYRQLEPFAGQTIPVNGTYPVDLSPDLIALLRAAQHNEYQEWEHDYAHFAQTAREEGFPAVEKLFDNIAQVERVHGARFGAFADLMERGELFLSKVETTWMCLECGYVTTGTAAPAVCPVCLHPQGFFIRMELSPFHTPNL